VSRFLWRQQIQAIGKEEMMKAYQHILLATDFSEFSEEAARRAADVAGHFNAKLTLLHVVEHFPEDMPVRLVPPEDVDPAKYVTERSRDRLEQLNKRIGLSGAILLVRMTPGSAKHEIIRVAEEINADLIVTGTHGHSGVSALVGSTAEGVVHGAPCEVLIVRSDRP